MIIKPVPTSEVVKMLKNVPIWINVFLPTQAKRGDNTKAAIVWIRLIIIGKTYFKSEYTKPTVYPP